MREESRRERGEHFSGPVVCSFLPSSLGGGYQSPYKVLLLTGGKLAASGKGSAHFGAMPAAVQIIFRHFQLIHYRYFFGILFY